MDCKCVGREQTNTASDVVQLIPSYLTQIINTVKLKWEKTYVCLGTGPMPWCFRYAVVFEIQVM